MSNLQTLLSDIRTLSPDAARIEIERAFVSSDIDDATRGVLLLKVLQKEGDFDAAISFGLAAMRSHPDALDLSLDLARLCFEAERYLEGCQIADACLDLARRVNNEAFIIEAQMLLAVAKKKGISTLDRGLVGVPEGYLMPFRGGEWWKSANNDVVPASPPWGEE